MMRDASYVMRHHYVREGLRLKYSEWEETIPEEIRADLLWKICSRMSLCPNLTHDV